MEFAVGADDLGVDEGSHQVGAFKDFLGADWRALALVGKTRVFLLRDEVGTLRGFSNLAIAEADVDGNTVHAACSGDILTQRVPVAVKASCCTFLKNRSYTARTVITYLITVHAPVRPTGSFECVVCGAPPYRHVMQR